MLMRQLAAPEAQPGTDAATHSPPTHPILRADDEHRALPPGIHALGGRAADAVRLRALEMQPRAAIVTVWSDGAATLQRTTAAVVVRIDGVPIGVAAVELRHGATIEFGDRRLFFEAGSNAGSGTESPAADRSTTSTTAARARALSLVGASSRMAEPRRAPSDSGEASPPAVSLVVSRSGVRHPLPTRRFYIGRDDSCDVVVRGSGVSRRHASIAPVLGGYMLRDESANGTLVNGVRVVGTYLLGHGDVVRIQDEELRVDLDEASASPGTREAMATRLDLAQVTAGTVEQAKAAANRAPTASLEIVRGPFSGASFQIERAVCSIGRGDENDVRIRDDTVSLVHATLLRKRGTWFVVDLRSMNGTFVDGSRVSGERALHPGARLRLGAVELAFRALEDRDPTPVVPPRLGVWPRLRALLRGVAPPGVFDGR